jgi:hypothetical protein
MSGWLWRAEKRLEFRYASDDSARIDSNYPTPRKDTHSAPPGEPRGSRLQTLQPPGNPRIIL